MIRDFDLGGATWSADFTDAASSHQRNLEGRLNGARWIASQHCFRREKETEALSQLARCLKSAEVASAEAGATRRIFIN